MNTTSYILSVFTPFGKITYHIYNGKIILLEDKTNQMKEDDYNEIRTNKEI